MKIRLRLTLLLGCLLAIFSGFSWLIRESHEEETQAVLTNLQQERDGLLDRLLTLGGQSLANFSTDYAHWDEMVTFLQTGDHTWASINIDQSLPDFDTQAVWVLKPDGQLHYATHTLGVSGPLALPSDLVSNLIHSSDQEPKHFFWDSPAGLIEIRACPILPSDFRVHSSSTLGWWLVGRLWNEQLLLRLSGPLQGKLSLETGPTHPTQPLAIYLRRELHDWRNHSIRLLCIEYQPTALLSLLDSNSNESLLFYSFSLTILLLTVLGLSRWVVAPLGKLERSLTTGNADALIALRTAQHEFGHLARLVEESFAQRDALQREIAERQKAEQDLLQSRELHSRLARDLHDGAIQSIYAAGLGLENIRPLLLTDPAGAEERLDTCLRSFNQTIASLRNFIGELESSSDQHHTLGQSMTALVQTMRTLQPVPIILSIDPRLAGPLNEALEIQLLQIVREALSNAIRHSSATSIIITFSIEHADRCRLLIVDNGQGFDPLKKVGTGHGLTNLTTRARELGGEIVIDSAPAKGTRLSITFNHVTAPRS